MTPEARNRPNSVTPEARDRPGAPAGWRLRPGVAVTPLRDGLHLRGRRGSVTLEGSSALPTLWRVLEGPLRAGESARVLDEAEPGSALRKALDTVLEQLRAHDLLVAVDGEAAPDWLAATGERPARAAAAIAGSRGEVASAAPDCPLAEAAARALEHGGAAYDRSVDPDLPAGGILLRADGAGPAVAAVIRGGTGYMTAPGSPEQARADVAALAGRLESGAAPASPRAFAALLGGSAAHRLLCAVAGLPDPAHEGDDPRLVAGLPAVLVATARPSRAEYRTWLGPQRLDTDRQVTLAPADTLATALNRVDALSDPHVGAFPEPLPGTWPQLPVPLAACDLPDGTLVAGAPRLDLARLDAFCRVAELGSGAACLAVGADPGHAWGRALRRAAERAGAPLFGDDPLPAADWSGHPQARHWWTTLTRRLGVRARLEVVRAVGDEEVYRAMVVCQEGAGRAGGPMRGWAVEATAGDAAAFAALSAVTTVVATDTGTGVGQVRGPDGATASLAAAGAPVAAWEDSGWTAGWLAELAGREAALQSALRRLTGLRAHAGPTAADRGLAALLHAFGFCVLSPAGDDR
ncbi:hypothetical protein LRS74_01630 [Streptomyces sp. LX-29]|uniref:hypothetical protein n=1 Tax=Streptomyces sp. LX-29 TaxID=2900152 RepID=UPI00240E420A|nr:hypothetical protein [Streptomyces sp. LX-29]WFB05869.1 hypothetical protein LRS74_01630 [Streptomyces sp. LX-29]